MARTPLEPWIRARIGLAESEPFLRSALERYQLRKLRETIAHARASSSFYRQQLSDCAVPGSLVDLARLPFTHPADLQKDERRFLCVSPREIERIVTLHTSGTTDSPKRLHFTADDLERTVDFFHHGMATMVQPGDKVLILMPGELPGSVGDLLVKGLARFNVEGIAHGLVRDAGQVLNDVMTMKVNCLVGIPVHLLALARHPAASTVPVGHLRSVLLSADYVPEAIVHEISNVWGAAVFNHYGMTEMGLGGAVECDQRCGYHVREADLLLEIVDPVGGARLPDGEVGEIVFTTLTRKGMPLIRYRTGDLARFLPDPCPCGSVLPRLERVTGRLANCVRLADGALLTMAALDEALFPLPFLLNFQPVLRSHNGLEALDLIIETVASACDETAGPIRQALLQIPAVAAACSKKRLLLGAIEPGSTAISGSIKRTIIDRRKEEQC